MTTKYLDNHSWFKFMWNLGCNAIVRGREILDENGNVLAVNINRKKQ